MALQLMKRLQIIFKKANVNIWLKPYEIFITSQTSAIIEFLPDTISIHALKKRL